MIRRLHFIVGAVGVVAFLMTGQYMDRWLGHLAGMADLPRMLYRSAHIYLLFAALLNLLLGLYADDHRRGWRRGVAWVGSVVILMAPAMILVGFARESLRTDFERPFVGFAIYGCFAGVLLHAIARRPGETNEPGRRAGISGRDGDCGDGSCLPPALRLRESYTRRCPDNSDVRRFRLKYREQAHGTALAGRPARGNPGRVHRRHLQLLRPVV